MDSVFIEGLEVYCTIGVHRWERKAERRLTLDVELRADCRPAGNSDDVAHAVDYDDAATVIRATIEGAQLNLVETVAERVAAALLDRFPRVASVRVRVAKADVVRSARRVGVVIERTRPAPPA